jgi:hypothetical protein
MWQKKIAGNDAISTAAVAAAKTIRQNVNLFWSFSTLNPPPFGFYPDESTLPSLPSLSLAFKDTSTV